MKKLLILGAAAMVLGLSAREPSMKIVDKSFERKGEKLQHKEWIVKFHHSDMNLKNTLDSEGKLVKKAWGDFFIGLRHGTVSNGSWDIWQFISVMDKKWKVMPEKDPVSKVSFVRFADSSCANMEWSNGTIRVLQTAGSQKWVYVKVTMPAGIHKVMLYVRPGGSHHGIKGRERHIRLGSYETESKNFKVNTMNFDGKTTGMAFFNKNYSEKNGNFLVFEAEKIQSIQNHTENPVTVIFYPKKGVTELNFALGYFLNEDAEEVTQRFLVEQLPTIRKGLDSIQWDKAPDFSEFTKNAAQVKSLIAGVQGDAKAKFEKEFAEIQKAYEDAKAKNDIPAYTQALERLRKLQKSIGAASLGDLM